MLKDPGSLIKHETWAIPNNYNAVDSFFTRVCSYASSPVRYYSDALNYVLTLAC